MFAFLHTIAMEGYTIFEKLHIMQIPHAVLDTFEACLAVARLNINHIDIYLSLNCLRSR